MSESKWILHYWGGFVGRAEFVRLIFEEAGVPFENNSDHCEEWFRKGKCRFGEAGIFPSFAPPLLQKGSFYLSSTPAICKYLGKQFGFFPKSEEDQAHAEQVNNAIHDYIGEARLAFHGVNHLASYFGQEKETQVYIDRFIAERLMLWLKHFEAVLRHNKGGSGFVIGDTLTYVDLALLHILRATEAQFPEQWKAAAADYAKLLNGFKARISARPNLAAYLASERCAKFSGNSMM
uniref:glutathione S-transferase P-like n=1 Tax=Styela clava TaxID=7725 RepID=UPI00193A7BCC|nr:glutathione S-transferase P-like [Styela clava]